MTDPFEALAPLHIRIFVGGAIILGFIAYDVLKNGRGATRLREYGFIFAVVIATMAYAILHDMITMTISPEYFTHGKGLSAEHLRWNVSELAMKAAIGPGAFVAMTYVLANNPSNTRAQLRYMQLARFLIFPVGFAILGAITFGILGALDVRDLRHEIEGAIPNASSFIMVWGVHWGTYVGGLIGSVVGVFKIRSIRAYLPDNVGAVVGDEE
jgi:hypothetical protein